MNNQEGKLDPADWLLTMEMELRKMTDEEKKDEQMRRWKIMYGSYTGEDEIVSSLEIAEDLKTRKPIPKMMSGIPNLDAILGGFTSKQLIVIAAPTKNGKTSFCIELTIRMKDQSPLWLPFEEPAEELIQKFLDRNEEPPLFYTPKKIPDSKLKWIENKIIEAKVKFGSNIVFIDHLHFIVPFQTERQDLAIGETMRELKGIAKRTETTIFIISHLKKTKMVNQPDLEDLRDSSFTAQEADTVIMLWRKSTRERGELVITNEVNVSVQANRRTGKTGNIKMVYTNGRFLEESKVKDELDEYKHEADNIANTTWNDQ